MALLLPRKETLRQRLDLIPIHQRSWFGPIHEVPLALMFHFIVVNIRCVAHFMQERHLIFVGCRGDQAQRPVPAPLLPRSEAMIRPGEIAEDHAQVSRTGFVEAHDFVHSCLDGFKVRWQKERSVAGASEIDQELGCLAQETVQLESVLPKHGLRPFDKPEVGMAKVVLRREQVNLQRHLVRAFEVRVFAMGLGHVRDPRVCSLQIRKR